MFRFIRRKSKSYKDYKDLKNYEKIKSKSDGKTYFGTWFDGHLFLPPFEELPDYPIHLFLNNEDDDYCSIYFSEDKEYQKSEIITFFNDINDNNIAINCNNSDIITLSKCEYIFNTIKNNKLCNIKINSFFNKINLFCYCKDFNNVKYIYDAVRLYNIKLDFMTKYINDIKYIHFILNANKLKSKTDLDILINIINQLQK